MNNTAGEGGNTDERAQRIKKRATDPKTKILNYLTTTNFDEKIQQHNDMVKQMFNHPYNAYQTFKERLKKDGGEASFPEFEGVVKFLVKALFQTKIYGWYMGVGSDAADGGDGNKKHILLDQVINKLIGLEIVDRFFYPYSSTIYVIENLLELLDYYYRNVATFDESTPVNETIGPYYHIFRYRSYMTTFLNSKTFGIPNNIVFPTCFSVGATHLIKIRCVPILIMGVVNEPIYVDQYINSPLDFWAHDIQHAKRQIQETLRYYDVFIKHNSYYNRRTLYDIKTQDQFYEYMEKFTKEKIIPMITLRDTDITSQDEEMMRNRAYRAIKKLIIFEVVHEKAWPITQPALCRNISLRYDEFPVENIGYKNDQIEAFHYLFSDPTTIGNVVGKLRHGFYDKVTDQKSYIVPPKYRTSRNVAICARQIMADLDCKKIPTHDYFLALTTDRHAMQEFVDLASMEGDDRPKQKVPYPDSEYRNANVYSDLDLSTYFVPSVDIGDTKAQDILHKKSFVEGYNPSIFEKSKGGGKNRKRKTRRKKYWRLKTRKKHRRKHRRRKKGKF